MKNPMKFMAGALLATSATALCAQTMTAPTTTTKSTTTTQTPSMPSMTPAMPSTMTPPSTDPIAAAPAMPDSSATTTTATTTTTADPNAATALATPADLKVGALVFDAKGGEVGTIESAKGDTAVVSTGKARSELPLTSFGKNDKGLVVSLTKAELDAQAPAVKTTTKATTKTSTKVRRKKK